MVTASKRNDLVRDKMSPQPALTGLGWLCHTHRLDCHRVFWFGFIINSKNMNPGIVILFLTSSMLLTKCQTFIPTIKIVRDNVISNLSLTLTHNSPVKRTLSLPFWLTHFFYPCIQSTDFSNVSQTAMQQEGHGSLFSQQLIFIKPYYFQVLCIYYPP